jgi:hypothetical protein
MEWRIREIFTNWRRFCKKGKPDDAPTATSRQVDAGAKANRRTFSMHYRGGLP